ncbi:MAG: gfo/Idh/MocA family oxidoreductase [Candidatus Coatesbacteria bacterium]|nr:MAG: gfo/Idh/MocA family oxidoreductase [Candidatus Coatesbacteria bacterium]
MSKVKIGVVGVGYLGSRHARILSEMPGVELLGVYDIDEGAREGTARKCHCRAFKSLGELAGAVDGVVVATPTRTHLEVAGQCLDLGRAVLVEKPIADTLEAGRDMVRLADASGALLQVGHSERFNPAFVAVGKFIHEPRFIETDRLTRSAGRGLDVDVILDLMIHDIDLIASCFTNDPSFISAVGVPVLSDNVDIANARLEFPNGAVANLVASRISISKMRKIRFFQPDTYISVNLLSHKVKMYHKQGKLDRKKPLTALRIARYIKRQPIRVAGPEPLQAELQAFVHSLKGNRPAVVSGADGLRALTWAFAIKDSIDQHFRVLSDASDG